MAVLSEGLDGVKVVGDALEAVIAAVEGRTGAMTVCPVQFRVHSLALHPLQTLA
jgi:hypothetical protein